MLLSTPKPSSRPNPFSLCVTYGLEISLLRWPTIPRAPFSFQPSVAHATSGFSPADLRRSLLRNASCHPHGHGALFRRGHKRHISWHPASQSPAKALTIFDPSKIAVIVTMGSVTLMSNITLRSRAKKPQGTLSTLCGKSKYMVHFLTTLDGLC